MIDKIITDIEQNENLGEDQKKRLITIYQKYRVMKEENVDRQELKKDVDDVLESMFKTAFSYSIPMDFINSPLGKFLFIIKFDIENSIIYSLSDLTILANKSKQMILNDYKKGNLEGIETGKKKRLIVTEEAAFNYITTVGRKPFTPEEAKWRLQMFNKLIREGLSEEKIRLELCKNDITD